MLEAKLIEPPKETTIQSLADYIAECASVVRDKDPKNNLKLLNRLLTEAVDKQPSRVLEYIPIVLPRSWIDSVYNTDEILRGVPIQHFGFSIEGKYHTNAREFLSWGWSLEYALQFVDFTNYKALHCVTPYFIYGQISTHTQLTTVSHSQRYADCDRGYWLSDDFAKDLGKIPQEQWNKVVEGVSPKKLVKMMKEAGIVRKEVFDRGADMLQYRPFTIGGFTNNPNAWRHFIEQRTDSHTQKETREFVEQHIETLVQGETI